jgi:hypothetical protein
MFVFCRFLKNKCLQEIISQTDACGNASNQLTDACGKASHQPTDAYRNAFCQQMCTGTHLANRTSWVRVMSQVFPATTMTWLAMLAYVSIGYIPQTTDICVCCQHVENGVPTRRQHSLTSANFSAVSVGKTCCRHTLLHGCRNQY